MLSLIPPASAFRRVQLWVARLSGHLLVRAVMEADHFIGSQGSHGVGAALIVTEFDLGH